MPAGAGVKENDGGVTLERNRVFLPLRPASSATLQAPRPTPPMGVVSTRVPTLAIKGRASAIAARTLESVSAASWLALSVQTSVTQSVSGLEASLATT